MIECKRWRNTKNHADGGIICEEEKRIKDKFDVEMKYYTTFV